MDEMLKEFFERVLDGVDKTAGFFEDQLPDYIEQLLMWHAVWSAVWFTFGILVLVVWCVLPWFFKAFRDEFLKDVDLAGFYVMSSVVVFFVCSIIIGFNFDWLQILVAPKVWLVEYASNLMVK